MPIQSVAANNVSFRGINIARVQNDPEKPAKYLAVMDEDTFERSNLPELSEAQNLEGPYGHPYSGRPIIHTVVEHKDDIKEAVNDIRESLDDDDKQTILETIVDLIKGFLGIDD